MKAGLYGPQAILGTNGVPAKGVSVTVYKHGTTTVATLWTGPTKTTKEANPTTTTASLGNLAFYATPELYDLSFTVGGVATKITVEVEPYYATLATPTLLLVTRTAAISWASNPGVFQVFPFDTVIADDAGGWSATTHEYTVKLPGRYHLEAAIGIKAQATACTGQLALRVGASSYYRGPGFSNSYSWIPVGVVSRDLVLAAGTVVVCGAMISRTYGVPVTETVGKPLFSMRWIGN